MSPLIAYVYRFSIWGFISLGFLLIPVYGEKALAQEGFTLASLKGAYAGTPIGWGGYRPQASVAVLSFDGAGSFSGAGIINLPGPLLGERILVKAPFVGTYTVNADGTGTTLNGGETMFVITKAKAVNGVNLAEAFAMVVKDLQPTGALVTVAFTRLPDEGEFTNASLKGTYAFTDSGRGGQTPEAGIGVITFDGNGNAFDTFVQNLPKRSFKERAFVKGKSRGSYTVNADGTGTALAIDGRESIFVITKVSVINGIKIAEEVFLIPKELSPTTGNLITVTATRLTGQKNRPGAINNQNGSQ